MLLMLSIQPHVYSSSVFLTASLTPAASYPWSKYGRASTNTSPATDAVPAMFNQTNKVNNKRCSGTFSAWPCLIFNKQRKGIKGSALLVTFVFVSFLPLEMKGQCSS